jgi:hypothetical protein
MINKSERYVRDRLKLLEQDAAIIEAVANGETTLTVAMELSRIDDPIKQRSMLRYVQGTGVNAKTAKKWVDEELRPKQEFQHGVPQPTDEVPPVAPAEMHTTCFFCTHPCSIQTAQTVWVHDQCIVERNNLEDVQPQDAGQVGDGQAE